MKNILLIAFALIGYTGIGQENLNEYKYIIIPKRLSEFKEENQYQTSTILKHEFGEKGFLAVYDDALPEDLLSNRCLGLEAFLNNNSSMFSTKLTIVLKDCKGQEVFTTKEAKNKIKEYSPAFREAIKEAMTSFDTLNYSYKEKLVDDKIITIRFKNDVKQLEEEGASLKKTTNMPKNVDAAVKQVATLTEQSYIDRTPVASDIKQAPSKVKAAVTDASITDVLYAQAIENGYQLVDSSPKVRMKLLTSSMKNVYMAQGDGKNGILFQKGDAWVFEYYSGDKLVQEELNIKF